MSSRLLLRLGCALLLAAGAGPVVVRAQATAGPGGGSQVYLALDEALALSFPGAQIERGTVYLTEQQMAQARELCGEEIESAIRHPYRAFRDGKPVGVAWVDVHRVRSLRESILVVVDPNQRVRRVELLAFGEPPEYIPRGNWYGQFIGRRLDDELDLRRGIRGITGATLTARATTAAVRRVLAVQRVIDGPPPAEPPSGARDQGGS
jgi:hypothetical protein